MRTKIYTLLLLTLLSLPAFAQHFEKKYGETGADKGYAIAMPSGGGYVLAGETNSFGVMSKQALLIRTNNNGIVQWSKTYGGSSDEIIYDMQAVSDGYIMCGTTMSYGAGGLDAYVIKVDTSGNLMWSKTFGGSAHDDAKSVKKTSDGGYIVAGYTKSLGQNSNMDAYVIKIDQSGNLQWEKAFGFSSNDWLVSISQTTDGGYIATGSINAVGAGMHDLYVVKLSSAGSVTWYNTFGGSGNDGGGDVQETTDGGYIVGGHTRTFGPNPPALEMWLMKLNSSGSAVWSKTYGAQGDDVINAVIEAADGSFVCLGSSNSFGPAFSMCLIRTDSMGVVQWAKRTRDTSPNYHYYASSGLLQAPNMDYAILGHSNVNGAGGEDFYISRATANTSCLLEIAPTTGTPTIVQGMHSPIVMTPAAAGGATTSESMVTAITTVVCNDLGMNDVNAEMLVNIYPNPAGDIVIVEYNGKADVEVIDALGQVVIEKGRYTVNNTAAINVKELAKGTYFVRLTSGKNTATKPIQVQ